MDNDLKDDAVAFIKGVERTRFLAFFGILAVTAGIAWFHDLEGLPSTLLMFFSALGAGILSEVFTVQIMIAKRDLRSQHR